MWSIDGQLINGMMIGLEFPTLIPKDELEDDEPYVSFGMVIDLLIFRLVIFKFAPLE